jgi:hypothetical protein
VIGVPDLMDFCHEAHESGVERNARKPSGDALYIAHARWNALSPRARPALLAHAWW